MQEVEYIMVEHQRFDIDSLEELKSTIAAIGADIPLSEALSILSTPISLGKKAIPNRIIIHPMEGCDGDADGSPNNSVIRRYDRFARGGAGLLWVEATAVVSEGRANPRQLYLSRDNIDSFKGFFDGMMAASNDAWIHGDGSTVSLKPYTVIQLTHSGRYSRPTGKPNPIIAARNPYLDKFLPEDYRIITDSELEVLEDKFVEAAVMANEIGFDAVDIKSCHRYLNSELLSAFTREGAYGGSFENRTRFLLNIIDKIRDRLGDSLDVTLRLNAYDAIPYPYGWGVDHDDFHVPDLSEPIKLVKLLQDRGVKLINISTGNPYYNPHVGRPYDLGYYTPPEHQLKSTERMLKIIKTIQESSPDMAVIATGFSWLREFGAMIAAGGIQNGWFKLAGFGRQAFAYPDFPRDIFTDGGMKRNKCCIACSKCSEIMKDGGTTGCVIKDSAMYAPIYKECRKGKPSLQSGHIAEHV